MAAGGEQGAAAQVTPEQSEPAKTLYSECASSRVLCCCGFKLLQRRWSPTIASTSARLLCAHQISNLVSQGLKVRHSSRWRPADTMAYKPPPPASLLTCPRFA